MDELILGLSIGYYASLTVVTCTVVFIIIGAIRYFKGIKKSAKQ